MSKIEIIERLENIANHAVYRVGQMPFIMSLDDGIAIHEAIEMIKQAFEWHETFEDDPDSFPNDDRQVLVSFSNFSLPMIGRWEVDDDGGGNWYQGDMDDTFLQDGLVVDGWWDLPKKPEVE